MTIYSTILAQHLAIQKVSPVVQKIQTQLVAGALGKCPGGQCFSGQRLALHAQGTLCTGPGCLGVQLGLTGPSAPRSGSLDPVVRATLPVLQ